MAVLLAQNINVNYGQAYRLDLWKADRAPDRVIKQTSEIAAHWHDWAANLVKAG